MGVVLPAQLSITSLVNNPTCEGGTFMAIGTGFTQNSTATVDGLAATVAFFSGTELRIDVPVGVTTGDSIAVTVTEGGNSATDSLWVIEVIPTSIDYAQDQYCSNDTNPVPVLTGVSGGTFLDVNATGYLIVNSMTGRIDLAASRSGVYVVGYIPPGPCAQMYTDMVEILPSISVQLYRGLSAADTSDTTICFGTEIEFLAIGGGTYDTFDWYLNDSALKLNAGYPFGNVWGEDDMPPGSDTIRVIINDQYGGSASDEIVFNVIGTPEVQVTDIIDPICSGDGVEITLISLTDNTYVNWTMTADELVVPNNISGQSTTVNTGGIILIGDPFFTILVDPTTASSLHYTFTSLSEGCPGNVIMDTVNVLPCEVSDFFIPGGITPNGDGFNDYWQISWIPAFGPADFEIAVFNRLGAQVYVLPSLDTMWAGEGLADGAYYYILRSKRSSEEIQKGELVIKRK